MNDVKIVTLGGGTGLSTMLRGLKKYYHNITAIVTVADNGGGSGVLREEMNMLPPGDIRNCIVALSNTEPIMEKIFNYRFDKGSLAGQSFGNLFLAAMNGIHDGFEEAVRHTGEVLAITGKVVPVSCENIQLCATFENGSIVFGESEIVQVAKKTKKKIIDIKLSPSHPAPGTEVIKSLEEADIIVLGPGSLYTSIIPNLLVKGVKEAINNSKAKIVYVGNIMTQPGETDGYNLMNHIETIEKYLEHDIIDYVIINNDKIPEDFIKLYDDDGAEPVLYNENDFKNRKSIIVESKIMKILEKRNLVRHDPEKLAACINSLNV